MAWFVDLPRPTHYGRSFLPSDINLQSWHAIEPYFTELEVRPLKTISQLTNFMRDRDELYACVYEELQRLKGARELDAQNESTGRRVEDFQRDVWSKATTHFAVLARKFLECPLRAHLDPKFFAALIRKYSNEVEMDRDMFKAVDTCDAELRERFQELQRQLTAVEQHDKEVGSLAERLWNPDRQVRERAWRLRASRVKNSAPEHDAVITAMVRNRTAAARAAGYSTYLEYLFVKNRLLNFTPQLLLDMYESVALAAVPLLHKLDTRRKRLLNVDVLRPWDALVAEHNVPDGHRYADAATLIDDSYKIFLAMDSDFADVLSSMRHHGLLSVGNEPGRAAINHSNMLTESRLPRIFMGLNNSDFWLYTILHESGHAVHAWLYRHNEPFDYRSSTTDEYDEFPSIAMVLLCLEKLTLVFQEDHARHMMRRQLEHHVYELIKMVRNDWPQVWLYLHPDAETSERYRAWREIQDRLESCVSWAGLESLRNVSTYHNPFEWNGPCIYAAPMSFALQLFVQYRRDRTGTIQRFKRSMALGASRSAPEIYEAAGVPFDLSPARLCPILDEIGKLLDEFPE
jgi:oligoendopeptidase F